MNTASHLGKRQLLPIFNNEQIMTFERFKYRKSFVSELKQWYIGSSLSLLSNFHSLTMRAYNGHMVMQGHPRSDAENNVNAKCMSAVYIINYVISQQARVTDDKRAPSCVVWLHRDHFLKTL